MGDFRFLNKLKEESLNNTQHNIINVPLNDKSNYSSIIKTDISFYSNFNFSLGNASSLKENELIYGKFNTNDTKESGLFIYNNSSLVSFSFDDKYFLEKEKFITSIKTIKDDIIFDSNFNFNRSFKNGETIYGSNLKI